uniref:Uncharacterized protein n=1 Tax=Setaria italica TaxID=4555 RepID=K4AGX5_SETIT
MRYIGCRTSRTVATNSRRPFLDQQATAQIRYKKRILIDKHLYVVCSRIRKPGLIKRASKQLGKLKKNTNNESIVNCANNDSSAHKEWGVNKAGVKTVRCKHRDLLHRTEM